MAKGGMGNLMKQAQMMQANLQKHKMNLVILRLKDLQVMGR